MVIAETFVEREFQADPALFCPYIGSTPLSDEDADGFKKFRDSASRYPKQVVSEEIDDFYGDKFATDKMGYEKIMDGNDKTIRQGIDGVYYDPFTNSYVAAEFKGQGSSESTLQKQDDWIPSRCQKILNGDRIYARAGETEQETARKLLDAYNHGDVRYELFRTKFEPNQQEDREGGKIYTEFENYKPLESKESITRSLPELQGNYGQKLEESPPKSEEPYINTSDNSETMP